MIASCKDVDGALHRLNEAYIGPDGCNRCVCLAGGSACTKRLCPENITSREAEAGKCVDNRGVLYKEGESYTHVDGCNTCHCTQAGGACTKMFCLQERVAVCEDGQKTDGESWLHKDGCNKCQCGPLGTICSERKCDDVMEHRTETELQELDGGLIVDESGDQPCTDEDGKTQFPGASWLTGDSCNICVCHGNGTAPMCTRMGCRVRLERLMQSRDNPPNDSPGSSACPLLLSSLLLPLLLSSLT